MRLLRSPTLPDQCNHLLVGMLVIALVSATIACGGEPVGSTPVSASPTGSPAVADIADVYRQLEQSLNQPGMLAHASITRTETTQGANGSPTTLKVTTELWVDAQRQVARLEVRQAENARTEIVTTEGRFVRSSDGSLLRGTPVHCPGAELAVAVVLNCPDAPFETVVFGSPATSPQTVTATPEVSIAGGERDSRPVVILTARTVQQPWRSNPITETRHLYLDAATMLPIAEEVERETGGDVTRVQAAWTHDFVAAGSVAAGFFDPLTLAEGRPDPQAALDDPPLGYALYWLGWRFPGAGGLPPLELRRVDRYNPGDGLWSGDQVTLEYGDAAQPFDEAPALRLFEYPRATWELIPETTHGPSGPCWTTEQIVLPLGEATIFQGFTWPDNVPPDPNDPGACPADRAPDLFFAHAFLGDTVVVIDIPADSRAQIEAALSALVQR